MVRLKSTQSKAKPAEAPEKPAPVKVAVAGSQTLLRGLDLLEAVMDKPLSLSDLSKQLDINRSTVHRLASALVERGYMKLVTGEGYMLGAKLLELGHAARHQISLPRVARPFLEALCEITGDAVHLGVLFDDMALYLDKLSGARRIKIGSRIGERHPLCSTGLGKSLLLDQSEMEWLALFQKERGPCLPDDPGFIDWRNQMRGYSAGGYSFDLEENEDRVRCIGAPIRGETGAIVAAVSVSSVAQYMSEARMFELIKTVTGTANAISRQLGWAGQRKL
jgi:DNA-binding IclR family transcriptional regulator